MKVIKKFFKFILYDWWMYLVIKTLQFFGLFIGYHWLWGNNKWLRTFGKKLSAVKSGDLMAKKINEDLDYMGFDINGLDNHDISGDPLTEKEIKEFFSKYSAPSGGGFNKRFSQYIQHHNTSWYIMLPKNKSAQFVADLKTQRFFRRIFRYPEPTSPVSVGSIVNSDCGSLNLKFA